jgi:hypothetical protein
MINLIPPQGQKSAKIEYVLRVGSTMSVLFGFVAILVAVAHIPTYVLIKAQIEDLDATSAKESGKEEAIATAIQEVGYATTTVARLKAVPETTRLTEFIHEIETRASSGISFKTFSVTETKAKKDAKPKITAIQVQGVAATRDILAQFKSTLETSTFFAKAEIPIADLVQDADLPFTVTLTLKKPI